MDHRFSHSIHEGPHSHHYKPPDTISWTDPRVLAWVYSSLIIVFYIAIMSIILCSNLHRFGNSDSNAFHTIGPDDYYDSDPELANESTSNFPHLRSYCKNRPGSHKNRSQTPSKKFILWNNPMKPSFSSIHHV